MSLTVTILAKNEAEMLPGALKSVSWVDQIIVGVDRTSTDNTEQIARDNDCDIYMIDLKKGFATAKNRLIAKAKMDWVLILDADERVTDELREEIQSSLANDSFNGYLVPFRNNLLGQFMKYGGWYPDPHLRLIRKGSGRYEAREIHEVMVVEGETSSLKGHIEHFTHRTIKEILRRIDQYSDLDSQIYAKDLPARVRTRNLALPALREFYRRYIKLKGYKDGLVGLIEAVLQSVYVFIGYAKAWELKK